MLSSTDLIARQAIDLQRCQEDLDRLHDKVLNARQQAVVRFEHNHLATIHDYNFHRGDLVLMRNTQIEVTHNKKMRPRYLGPLVVISRNRGSTYILCELDGSVLHRPVAAFRLVPYFAREQITIPNDILDIDTAKL